MALASYSESHKAPGRGVIYERNLEANPLACYLLSREETIVRSFLKQFFGEQPVDLLDFACGTGRIAAVLENVVRSSTGIDISESMLEVARQRLRCTRLYRGNLLQERLFSPGQFNLITAFRFFLNAEPELRRAALRALAPLLRQDGYLVFNNHGNQAAPYVRMAARYARTCGQPPAVSMSLAECQQLLAETGFVVVRVYPAGMLHVPKLQLPRWVYRLADSLGTVCGTLTPYCEDPVLVARHRVSPQPNP